MKEEGSYIDVGNLSLLVFVVILSCCLGTLLSWIWIRSVLPRSYHYCTSCASQMDLMGIFPKEESSYQLVNNVPVRSLAVNSNSHQSHRNADEMPYESMKYTDVKRTLNPNQNKILEHDPVVIEESNKTDKVVEYVNQEVFSNKRPEHNLNSPASVEALARKNKTNYLAPPLCPMSSKRTLLFPSRSFDSGNSDEAVTAKAEKDCVNNSPNSGISTVVEVDCKESHEDYNSESLLLMKKSKQVRRKSISARKKKSTFLMPGWSKKEDFTSQSEEENILNKHKKPSSTRASSFGYSNLVVVNEGFVSTTDQDSSKFKETQYERQNTYLTK